MSEKKIIEFGTAKAEPGHKGTGYIKVGELSDGSPVNMPVLDAVNNVLPKFLKDMNGSMVVLPATNISAFRGNPFGGGIRNSPLDIDQGARLPSLYPGNPYGRHTDQLAYQINKVKTVYDPDVLVRYHGCKQIYGWDRVLYQKSPAGSELDNLARAAVTVKDSFCLLVYDRPSKGERSLEVSVESNGGDNGVGNGYNGDNMREAILNIMRYMKMIPGKVINAAPIQYVSYKRIQVEGGMISSSGINSTRGGFFKPLVNIKDSVKEGQTVGEIRNFFGEVVEEIKSPINGTVIGYYCEAPHVGSGQWRLFEIAEPTELR
jgi:hypothetical protein